MKKYLTKEILTPAVTFLFLLLYVSEASKLSAPIVGGVPQETFFPLIIFIIGIAASLSLLVPAVKKANAAGMVEKGKKPVNHKPLYVVLATAFLIFFFDILGFLFTAPIYVFMLMMIYDDKPQYIIRKIIYSVLITAFVFVLYTYIFEINFPQIWR